MTGVDGTEWYFPQRLTDDTAAVANGNANPAQQVLDVDATMGHQLPKSLLIYAFGARLGGARVLTGATALAQQSGIPRGNLALVNRRTPTRTTTRPAPTRTTSSSTTCSRSSHASPAEHTVRAPMTAGGSESNACITVVMAASGRLRQLTQQRVVWDRRVARLPTMSHKVDNCCGRGGIGVTTSATSSLFGSVAIAACSTGNGLPVEAACPLHSVAWVRQSVSRSWSLGGSSSSTTWPSQDRPSGCPYVCATTAPVFVSTI